MDDGRALVQVSSRLRPFLQDFRHYQVAPGITLRELVRSEYPHPAVQACAVVFLDGRPVLSEGWDLAPLGGQSVSLSLVPQDFLGLGSDTLRTALSTIISFGAVAAGSAIGGPLGWAIGTGVAALSWPLLNWLIPPSEVTLDQTGYSLTGGRNQVTQYGAFPKIYGRVRHNPPLGALPYTESLGEDQYIRAFFILGYGPLTVRDVRIGDIAIMNSSGGSAFEGVQLEIREGLPGDAPITLVTQSIDEEEVGQKLSYGQEPIIRTTAANVDEISLDLEFPGGLCNSKDEDVQGWSVYVRIRYRLHDSGSGGWVEVDEVQANQLQELASLTSPAQISAWLNTLTDSLTQAAADIAGLDPEDWTATEETQTRLIDWLDTAAHAVANARNPENDETLWQAIEDAANAIAAIAPLVGGTVIVPFAFAGPAQAITDLLALVLDGVKVLVDINDYQAQGYGPALSTFPPLERWYIQMRGLSDLFPESTPEAARITGATVKPTRRGYRWKVAQGRYDVWVEKVSEDADPETWPDVIEEMYWSLLRSIQDKRPLNSESVPPMALIAIRVKASDQFTGSLDQVNCEVTARLPVAAQDGEGGYAWTVEETRNPAWAWLDSLRGPQVPRPVTLDRIENLDDVIDWAEACDTELFHVDGEADRTGRTFDVAFLRQMTVDSMAKAIAAAGQASHGRPGGKFGIVRDVLQEVPDQHFTPANSWGFQCTVKHAKLPNCLRVLYNDAEQDNQQTERLVYDDGFNAGNAVTYETLEITGCSDGRQAWVDGRNFLAQLKLRPRRFTLNSMDAWLTCRRGGLVRVVHDVPMWGLAWGRIRSISAVTEPAPDPEDPPVPVDPPATLLRLDNAIPMKSGRDYGLVLIYSDGYGFEVMLDQVALDGEYTEVSFQGVFPLSPASRTSPGGVSPEAADLWMAGEHGQVTHDLKIVDISTGKDKTATLSLVDAAPEIHRDPNLPIPPFNPETYVPPPLNLPRPDPPAISVYPSGHPLAGQQMILADERACIVNPDGSLTPTIIVCLDQRAVAVDKPQPNRLEVQYLRQADAGHDELPNMQYWVTMAPWSIDARQVQIFGLPEKRTYAVRLRYTCDSGLASAWAEVSVYLSGKTNPPPNIVNVLLENGRILKWSYGNELRPVDFRGFYVRQYPGIVGADQWDSALPIGDGFLTNTILDVGLFTAGERTFFVKAVDSSGNLSAVAGIVQVNVSGATPQNVVYSESQATLDWPGGLTGGEVDGGYVQALPDSTGDYVAMYPNPWTDLMYPEPDTGYFYEPGWQTVTYVWTFTPPAGTGGYPMSITLDTEHALGIEVGYTIDGVHIQVWPGQLVVDEALSYTFIFTMLNAPSGSDRPVIRDAVVFVDVPDITEHFEDVAITDAGAGVRLPIVRSYHRILGVGGLTLQSDTYGAIVIKVEDKGYPSAESPTQGPLVKAYNAAGSAVLVDAFDATVWGY